MKTIHYLTLLLMSGIFFIPIYNTVNAQDTGHTMQTTDIQMPGTLLTVITADDYPYFLHLSELQNYSNIDYRGRLVNFNEQNHYRLSAVGANSSLRAIYNSDGSLRNAKLITKDSRLPVHIYRQVAMESKEGWIMTGNRMIVRNFNPNLTKYQVTLSNGEKQKTMRFDASGKKVKLFARR